MPLQLLHVNPPSILKNEELQLELNREGVVQFPFLSPQALSDLYEVYEAMHPESPKGPIPGFYVSVHSPDLNYKIRIEEEIRKIVNPICHTYFKDYKWVTSAMQIKMASPDSKLGIHQDWSVVDESRYASYGLWVPLVDVTPENGALMVLKRSHRIGPTYRHTALPSVYSDLGNAFEGYYTPIEAKAGHAIVFNQAVLHQSAPNLSMHPRPSVIATVIPATADHLMYVASSESADLLDAYIVKNDYVQYFHSFFEDSANIPAGAVKSGIRVNADFTPVSVKDFDKLYHELLNER